MLYDNGGVGHERPEIVGAYARIALQMVQEGLCIRVVVGIWVSRLVPYTKTRKTS